MQNTVAADFFTVEVVTPYALVTLYVLFFIHHATRRVLVAGVTTNPDTPWMMQIARNVTMEGTGFLNGMKYLIHDGDSKFCPAFYHTIESAGVDLVPLPPKSPNLVTSGSTERRVEPISKSAERPYAEPLVTPVKRDSGTPSRNTLPTITGSATISPSATGSSSLTDSRAPAISGAASASAAS